MKNYLDNIYIISQFKNDHPALAEQAEKARNVLAYFVQSDDQDNFVIIEVEGYKCVAFVAKTVHPYELAETIVPFDKDRVYPIQGLVTRYLFKRYH